jgi:hypothetical protein
MNVVQFEIPGVGRRVGVVDSGTVVDVTSGDAELQLRCGCIWGSSTNRPLVRGVSRGIGFE